MTFTVIYAKILQILFPSNFYYWNKIPKIIRWNVRISEIFKSYFIKEEKQYLLKILKNKISQYV